MLATIANRKAGFRSLGNTWAYTTSAHGRLMLTVLDGLAVFERELTRAQTGERRARAKAYVAMGYLPKMTPHLIKEALRRRAVDEPMSDIACTYNVSRSTTPRRDQAADCERQDRCEDRDV